MKIVKLTASNFKRLVAVEITPDGNVITISGKNAAGKSSVLDAIVAGLGGKSAAPEKPIREGEKSAEIVVDTGEFVVTRKFTAAGSYLEIKNKDGFKAPSPQALLDKIVGKIAFDPLTFCRLPAKDQRQALLDLVGVDVSAHDKAIERLKLDRSMAMAQKKRAAEDAEKIPFTEGLPEEPVSVTALADRLVKAQAANAAITQKEMQIRAVRDDRERQSLVVEKLRADLASAEDRYAVLSTKLQIVQKELGDMVPLDVVSLRSEMAGAEAMNTKIALNKRRQEAMVSVEGLGTKVTDLYAAVQNAEADKALSLADAGMPLEGLGVSDGTVTFGGIPLAQVNHAKQVEISMAIAMAMNPAMRVMLVNGNGLDTETMAEIDKLVKDHDYQLWLEKATDGEPVGVVIEDGQVKQTEGNESLGLPEVSIGQEIIEEVRP